MKRFLPIFCCVLLCTLLPTAVAKARDAVPSSRTPYINKVYEYMPAPGQFINVLPAFETGDDMAAILRKVEALIVDTIGSTNYICLGAWGGYVTFGFDHPIVNVEGEADFEVGGNYFDSSLRLNPYPERNVSGTFSRDTLQTGSSEPGIIYVSRDENGNGLPDDTWYEIAGSEYPYSIADYSITYYRPASPSDDVRGIDCFGNTILVRHNAFHQQIYYPEWLPTDSFTLRGSLLPNNLLAGTTSLVTLDYGYADNARNGSAANGIDISWAVTSDGQPARLTSIDFVRVQTGVSQDGGIMGETSTELTGARDLHPDAPLPDTGDALPSLSTSAPAEKILLHGRLLILHAGHYYDLLGRPLSSSPSRVESY